MIAVVGACGGAGTSVLAAALARTQRRTSGATALVDLDVPGGGLDVLLGAETAPGARWGDLADARGTVDGTGLLAALPRWGAVPLVSGTRHEAERPADAVVLDVTTALLRGGHRVVLDLPGPAGWTPAGRSLLAAADAVVLVVPLTAPAVAGAFAVQAALAEAGADEVRLVVRPAPGRVDVRGIERALGRPVVATVGWDARLAAAVERGEGPRTGRRTPLGRAAAALLEPLGTGTAHRAVAA